MTDEREFVAGFESMLVLLADHVHMWEMNPIDPVGEHLHHFIDTLVRDNSPEKISYLVAFLAVSQTADGILRSLLEMREFHEAELRKN